MASDDGNKITLKSSDGEEFVVDEAVAKESQTILHMIEDGCAGSGIPLPNVNSKILAKVIEYCKKHVDYVAKSSSAVVVGDKLVEEDLKNWDSEFVKIDQATLFDIILGQFGPAVLSEEVAVRKSCCLKLFLFMFGKLSCVTAV